MIWGLSEEEWKELKDQQYELNRRRSKNIETLDHIWISKEETKEIWPDTNKEMKDDR